MSAAEIADRLRTLGLRASRDALSAFLTHAVKSRLGPVELCEGLIVLEQRERDACNLARRTRDAALGTVSPLDHFDWNHPRSIDHDLYEHLLTLEFVGLGHNVLFRGPSGVGKTTLAQNLGLQALQRGRTVRFATLAAALADLLKHESLPALERKLRRYTQPDLLILDEIGYLPCDARAADLLFMLVSRRHEKRSTIMATNLPFKQWSTIFPGAACVAAMIDRFAQHCHVMDIDADSWRQKTSLQSVALSSKRVRRSSEMPASR
jgi:DNA replication protein DnaC